MLCYIMICHVHVVRSIECRHYQKVAGSVLTCPLQVAFSKLLPTYGVLKLTQHPILIGRNIFIFVIESYRKYQIYRKTETESKKTAHTTRIQSNTRSREQVNNIVTCKQDRQS